MDENHEGYKILRGVRLDVKKLLTNFQETGSVRFADFCNVWKKMQFSLIFCGRRHLPELLEFSEEIIHITKGYLEPPWNFHIRVGALFTLYGLYFKQPIHQAAKIRLTKQEWSSLCQLIEDCKEAKHYDICFVHYKLFINGAYVFTIVPRATGLERGFRKYELKPKVFKSGISERVLKRPNIIEPDLLDSLASVENQYAVKKCEVLGKKNLEFVDKDFASALKLKIAKFNATMQSKYPSRAIEDIDISGPSTSASSQPVDSEKPSEQVKDRSAKTVLEKKLHGTNAKRPKRKSRRPSEEFEISEEVVDNSKSYDLPEI